MSRSWTRTVAWIIGALALASAPAGGQETTAPAAPKATAAIAGRVVAARTGRPIARATISIISWEVMRVRRGTATDADGRYEFKNLLPGRYEVTASAGGFVASEYGGAPSTGMAGQGRPIDVRDGERFEKADFSLQRPGAIEGRLLDEFGDPAPDLRVQLATLEFVAGRHRLLPGGSAASRNATDDKGSFRIAGLAPGDYYLIAPYALDAERDGAAAAFAPTLAPGATDLAGARPIRVRAGEDITDLTLSLVPAQMARIAGRLVDAAGQPVANGVILLNQSDRSGAALILPVRTSTRPDGSFAFANVPPGSYAIQGFGRPTSSALNLGAMEFGWLPVSVNGVDVSGLVVRVRSGPSARGRIVLEDDDGTLKPGQVRVAGRPVEFDSAPTAGGPSPSETRADWTFEARNLSGLRVLQVDVAAPEWNLKRILLNGRDVTDTPLDFREDDIAGLEVVLTRRAPSIEGRVTDRDLHPIGNYSLIVFASDPARWTFPSRFVVMGRPSQDGTFVVRGLPPEDYLVVAIPPVRGTRWQDPEFLALLRGQATPVTLGEGDRRRVELKLAEY